MSKNKEGYGETGAEGDFMPDDDVIKNSKKDMILTINCSYPLLLGPI